MVTGNPKIKQELWVVREEEREGREMEESGKSIGDPKMESDSGQTMSLEFPCRSNYSN